ncbi:hypothetical protein NDU88_001838 [Pleurodeles waltl]|uniref:Iron-binding zinc finger CDGSH type domain-containing protein n=1 Tax=Pleurodeles waltl TaxID=8319 RepID=A0AAV7Q504_PLEWA|nr:hypothetical protein NDU88_001838 [Pleurodeles waltl]
MLRWALCAVRRPARALTWFGRIGSCQVRWFTDGSAPAPVIAAKHPFQVDLTAEKRYAWCACGHSKKQPFCDGSHKKASPSFSPLRFVVEESKTVWLCGCKQTKNQPYCDGTHKSELVQKS